MKTENFSLFTSKNILLNEKNNLVYSLMIKGGIIRRLSSGVYIWLPNGIKIINNVINLIKKYFNKINAMEINIPIIQPSYIWKKSGRYIEYGKELFKFYDRNNKLFILSPTHEEVITQLICNEKFKSSFFPKIFYQIQKKFRDEIRPKLGIIRSREFFMKDAYSFHLSLECLDKIYFLIYEIYKDIFKELGLNFFCKEANCGNIKGFLSHEFHIISKYGENKIFLNNKKKILGYSFYYKKNNFFKSLKYKKIKNIKLFSTKNLNKLSKWRFFLKFNNFIKTNLVEFIDNKKTFFLLILTPFGKKIDINKLYKIYSYVNKIIVWNKKKIFIKFGFNSIFLGPFLKYKIISDYSLMNKINFIVGSNKNRYFYINVNWFINVMVSGFYDICKNWTFYLNSKININEKNITELKSTEIAHIFKLGNYYSSIFNNNYKFNKKISMGCYGIGITRIISCLVELYHDNNGIIWPLSIANFKLGILPIDMYKYNLVYQISIKIYNFLIKNNISVLLDNRKLYTGEMFADLSLIGIPNLLILSNKMLSLGLVEFQDRLNKIKRFIYIRDIFSYLLNKYK